MRQRARLSAADGHTSLAEGDSQTSHPDDLVPSVVQCVYNHHRALLRLLCDYHSTDDLASNDDPVSTMHQQPNLLRGRLQLRRVGRLRVLHRLRIWHRCGHPRVLVPGHLRHMPYLTCDRAALPPTVTPVRNMPYSAS